MFILLVVLVYCTMLFSQGVAGFQEYFIPGPEDNLSDIWDYVYGTIYDDNFRIVVSITATSDNTDIIYDHWEDGYSDSDASNIPLTLNAGEYYAFEDLTVATDDDDDNVPPDGIEDPEFTAGVSSTYNIDGGDRIYVTGGPVFVVRAALPHDYMSACWELLPVQAWRGDATGIDFTIPFGTDLQVDFPELFHDFTSVAIVIQSAADGNTITLDCPDGINDWSGDVERGETQFFTDVRKGTTVSCDSKAQIHMVIGSEYGYDLRGISGIPALDGQANDYWAPIEVSLNTDMFIYNHNASSITINYEDVTTGSFSVSAGETVSYHDKTTRWVTSGAHVYTSGAEFCAVLSVDTDSGSQDWACGLTQYSKLGTDYRIGWAPGSSDASPVHLYNAVFAIATEDDTDIFVDFDGNGTIDQSFNGSNSLDKLDVVLIGDQSDHDTSGARIWSNDKKIALTYGEISGTNQFEGSTPNVSPAMDLGYAILPMPDAWIEPVIEVSATNDQGTTPIAAVDENVLFTITLNAHDYILESTDLHSCLDIGWVYESGTTNITHYVGEVSDWTSTTNPAITGTSDPGYHLDWAIDRTVAANDSIVLTFQAHPTSVSEEGENEIVSETMGSYDSHQFNAYDSEFITLDGEPGVFGDEPVPVCLGEFLISIDNGVPVLAWTTQSESNNLGWNIYRNSEDDFANAAQVNSQLIEGAGFSSIPTEYSFADNSELESGSVYWYYLEDVSYSGSTSIIASGYIHITEDIPVYNNAITGIYPNPFNPSTMISFSIENTAEVTLSVYNNRGQKVLELLNSTLEAGEYTEEWNGTNLKGNRVSSGVYFVNLSFKGRSITKKMLLIK
jgi:hypothetical protein